MRAGLSWLRIVNDLVHFLCLGLRSRTSLSARIYSCASSSRSYQETQGQVAPCRRSYPSNTVLLSRWLNWRDALTVVRPKTFVAWHRKGFRHFCRRKSEAGRRPIPVMLQHLICCFDSSLFGETLSGVTLFTVCPVKIGSRHKNGTR